MTPFSKAHLKCRGRRRRRTNKKELSKVQVRIRGKRKIKPLNHAKRHTRHTHVL